MTTFYDFCVSHPYFLTYKNQTMKQIYNLHEAWKMKKCNDRIIEVEKGTYTSLIYVHKIRWMGTTVNLLSQTPCWIDVTQERGEVYCHHQLYMRTRIRFCILRITLLTIRGEWGKHKYQLNQSMPHLSTWFQPQWNMNATKDADSTRKGSLI